MLTSLTIQNFTVFPNANLRFGKNLNVIVGENGSGKTHILKAAYSGIAFSAEMERERVVAGASSMAPGKAQWQMGLAAKLKGVFRPDGLWRLVSRSRGRSKCELTFAFSATNLNFHFSFSSVARQEVTLRKVPGAGVDKLPVFLPTRELLSIYPGFVSLYDTTHLSFEETWRDTCILLGAPLARGARDQRISHMLRPLEEAMGGKVELDKAGRFYLSLATGKMEIHLVAEGLRKLATIARLISTGSLLDKGYLFWDEPESNLNPRIVKAVAKTILQIAQSGIQVFVATHSLFLLRELHILQQGPFAVLDAQYFGLHVGVDGTAAVVQGPTVDDIGSIAALDEDLQQSDRYIDTELGVSGDTNLKKE